MAAASLCDGVHVWSAELDGRPARETAYASLLTPDERERAARFYFERDRRRFVMARGLLRVLLGVYLGQAPSGIRLTYGPRGKPGLSQEADRGLRFNVSHSGGRALLAFVRERDLGVDLERERPMPELETIARRFFSSRECAALLELPPRVRPAAFFRCWTRKEAYLKATGDGLARPLDAFDVTLAAGEPARLLRVLDEPEASERWWLEHLEPAAGFHAALAVEGRPARVDFWDWRECANLTNGVRHASLSSGASFVAAGVNVVRRFGVM